MDIANQLLTGSKLALSRAITAVENDAPEAVDIIRKLYPHTGGAYVIGITGLPGAGKSTLIDRLAKEYRRGGKTMGIIAVDPVSPFSGGAILGDRIRMNQLSMDEGIFIRSMATRGSLGGLSRKTADVVKMMDAFGKQIVFVETVGVGQSEVDIAKNADTTIVVLVPGLGDDIQAIKAGILEIGDIFVVNKADREDAGRLKMELEMMFDLSQGRSDWRPPVQETVASKGAGIGELAAAVERHAHYLENSGKILIQRRERVKKELVNLLEERISRHVFTRILTPGKLEFLAESIVKRQRDTYSVAAELLDQCFGCAGVRAFKD